MLATLKRHQIAILHHIPVNESDSLPLQQKVVHCDMC